MKLLILTLISLLGGCHVSKTTVIVQGDVSVTVSHVLDHIVDANKMEPEARNAQN